MSPHRIDASPRRQKLIFAAAACLFVCLSCFLFCSIPMITFRSHLSSFFPHFLSSIYSSNLSYPFITMYANICFYLLSIDDNGRIINRTNKSIFLSYFFSVCLHLWSIVVCGCASRMWVVCVWYNLFVEPYFVVWYKKFHLASGKSFCECSQNDTECALCHCAMLDPDGEYYYWKFLCGEVSQQLMVRSLNNIFVYYIWL